MRHARPLPFTRRDSALLAIVAALAVASAAWADFEHTSFNRWYDAANPPSPDLVAKEHRAWSRWPYWVQAWRIPGLRVLHDVRSFLVVASVGLGLLTFRPRRGFPPGRWAPGHVASAVAAVLATLGVVMVAREHLLDPLVLSGLGTAASQGLGRPALWYWVGWEVGSNANPGIAILAAWLFLAALGPRGRPIDPYDRAGRWLGLAWIAQWMASWFLDLMRFS